jgi:hypothetical protein
MYARTEYQKESGNLPHKHIIILLNKGTLILCTGDFLNDILATNAMKIVKPDQVDMLIAEGLLLSKGENDGIIQEGWRKLDILVVKGA